MNFDRFQVYIDHYTLYYPKIEEFIPRKDKK